MGLMRVACAVVTLAVVAVVASGEEPLPIIPGAHGFGMETPAGSGRHLEKPQTQVIKVTNLNDAGPGSLRAALAAKGPRVVVFEVSGYIELDMDLVINNPYLTVAGQTAPWPGIVVRGGYPTNVGASDFLIQHIGFRPGGQWKGGHKPHRCAIRTGPDTRRVIIDHCSFGWTTQVGLNLNGSDSTVRHNIFSEGLYNAGHNEREHSVAMGIGLGHTSVGSRKNIALVGNLFAHNKQRNPVAPKGTTLCLLNNVTYNYAAVGLKSIDTSDKTSKVMSIIGNVYIPGVDTGGRPETPWYGKPMWIYLSNPESRVFLSPDNLFAGKTYDNPWKQIYTRRVMAERNSKPEPRAVASKPPLEIPGYEVKPARETEAWVLANVGPHPARRSPIDARIVYETRTRTGRGRDDVEDAGGWPKLEENRRELTLPKNPNADDDGDGYTNLEEWLHAFADEVEGRKGPIAGADPTLGEREAKRCATEREIDQVLLAIIKNRPKADWAFDEADAKRRQQKAAQDAGLPVTRQIDLGGGVALDLVLIPAGKFMMGAKYPALAIDQRGPGGNRGLYKRDYPGHRVKITRPYYMGKYEVTQDIWEQLMGKRRWKRGCKGARNPAHGLSWNDAQTFIRRLNDTVGKEEKLAFRLPTEAEWENACRAGTETPFHFGEQITTDLANYNGGAWDGKKGVNRARTVDVGTFPPNAWGLCDMAGNVQEWVEDFYAPYPEERQGPLVDPVGPKKGEIRVIRGGSWRSGPAACRSGASCYYSSHRRFSANGLRVAAVPAERE